MSIKQILSHPIRALSSFLGANEKVKLTPDNCSPGFEFTEVGKIPIEKIEMSIKAMKEISVVEENITP